jgi:chitin disaccharide deacetylase
VTPPRPFELPLAICVDDYGLHAGVNVAAIALAGAGRVSAISAMVGGPAWSEGASALRGLAPEAVDVGLHLDLTEHPLHSALRRPLAHWLLGAALLPSVRVAVRREIEAQLDAFEAGMRRPPAHVDGHRHVHQLPGIRQELLAVLGRRYSTARPWVRNTQAPAGQAWSGGKPRLIAALGAGALQRLARSDGWVQNRHLLGVWDFGGDPVRYLARVRQWLRAAQPGDLWMCHPAAFSPPGDGIAAARLAEYQVLASPELGTLLRTAGVRVQPVSRMRLT